MDSSLAYLPSSSQPVNNKPIDLWQSSPTLGRSYVCQHMKKYVRKAAQEILHDIDLPLGRRTAALAETMDTGQRQSALNPGSGAKGPRLEHPLLLVFRNQIALSDQVESSCCQANYSGLGERFCCTPSLRVECSYHGCYSQTLAFLKHRTEGIEFRPNSRPLFPIPCFTA